MNALMAVIIAKFSDDFLNWLYKKAWIFINLLEEESHNRDKAKEAINNAVKNDDTSGLFGKSK